jgi:hypothetical protein
MFPEPTDAAGVEEARRVCRGCPLATREECVEGAIDRREQFGVWGGLVAPRELETRRRRRFPRKPTTITPAAAAQGHEAPQHAPVGVWEDATLPFAV